MEDNFEKQWREAFEDASQEPPKIVWSQVSEHLADQRVVRMQRSQWIYQGAAAAAIMLAAFFGYQNFTSGGNQARMTQAETNVPSGNQVFSLPIYQPHMEATGQEVAAAQIPAPVDEDEAGKEIASEEFKSLINFELLETNLKIEGNALAVNYGEVKDHLYGVPATYLAGKKKAKDYDGFWAGVNVAGGSFDPNYEGGDTNLSKSLSLESSSKFSASNLANDVDSNSPLIQESMSSGQTLGFGVNFGLNLSDRWTLQSGIQYSQASATTTTNAVIETRQLVNPIPVSAQFARVSRVQDVLNAEEVVNYEYMDVDLNNKFQFASIPVKAGYKIIDQKFSVGINAGVLANLYLGNKLTDPTNQVAELTIGPGNSSPYKQINFMGLAGIQLGYQVLNRFDLTLEPNYRHSLNSFTKADSEFNTNPSGLGLQTGIRYRFH